VTGMTGGISLSSTSLSQATLPSFNPEMATADLRGSANAVVTLNIVDTRKKPDLSFVVPMTTNGQSLPNTYGASIMYMPGVLEVADALYDDATRPPGLDVLVKAGAPCAVTMNMSISKPSNYNGPSAAELTASIAAAVNQLPMRQAYLDDFTISQIIKTASSSLTLQTLAMFGTVTAFDGSIVGVSQLGNKLTIPVDTAKKISYETTFFTTNVGSISVNLV
jgi:hypothetical protein